MILSISKEYVLDAHDERILSLRDIGGHPGLMTVRYIGFVRTRYSDMPWPTYKVVDVDWSRDPTMQDLSYVMVFDAPKRPENLTQRDFEWWTYASTAVDADSGARFGPGDTPLEALPSTRSHATRARPLAQMDRGTIEQAGTNPDFVPLPRRRVGLSRWFVACGVTCLLLAGAWVLRRRFA